MPHRPTEAQFVRRLFRDATSTSKRAAPARRAFANKVLNAVLDRAERQCPELLRRHTQQAIYGVHSDAVAGSAEAIEQYLKHAPVFRADGYDVPALPGDEA